MRPAEAAALSSDTAVRPAWLRPAAFVIALGLHAAAAGFVAVRALPPSPIDSVEVTLIAEGDAAETKLARPEIAPAEASAAPVETPAPAVEAVAAPIPAPTAAPAPDVPELAAPPPQVAAPEALPLPQATPTPERTAVRPPIPVKTPAAAPKEDRPTPAELRERRRQQAEAAERRRQAQAAEQAARLGAEQAREAANAASRASYKSLLAAEINRHKFYPSAAQEAGITGSVRVGFTVGPTGAIVEHRITQSSGSALLDGAVDALMAAIQAPPPPGGSIHIDTTISFALRQ